MIEKTQGVTHSPEHFERFKFFEVMLTEAHTIILAQNRDVEKLLDELTAVKTRNLEILKANDELDKRTQRTSFDMLMLDNLMLELDRRLTNVFTTIKPFHELCRDGKSVTLTEYGIQVKHDIIDLVKSYLNARVYHNRTEQVFSPD